jgi:hypothetical protein
MYILADEQKRLQSLRTAKRVAVTARKAAKWMMIGAQVSFDAVVGLF